MIVEKFLHYLSAERNYSQKTVFEYGNDLRHFEDYCNESGVELQWETLDADVIRNWMMFMMKKHNSAASVNRRLSSIRRFYKYLLSNGFVEKDPTYNLKGPKKEKRLPSFLKEDEMNRLLDDIDFGDGFEAVRDKLIIRVFYSTGVRLAELRGLDDLSVDFANSQLKVTGKRNKQRIIPFGPELSEALKRYVEVRNELVVRNCQALFVTSGGGRMTKGQVEALVRQHLSKVSTMKKLSPHVLRHTFATVMLNHDADLETVQKLLGHESLATTQIYTHVTFEELKKAYKQAHPRA